MWLLYKPIVALIVNIILAIFLIIFVTNGIEIYKRLYVGEDEAVSGKFQDFGRYENLNDLDNRGYKSHP
jgi:hypothetical protein